MREGRKEKASKVKQTTRQRNTAHPRQSLFLRKMSCLGYIHVLMRDERRKEGKSKQGQTNNKAKQHSTPKAVTFPKKNELPRVYTCFNER